MEGSARLPFFFVLGLAPFFDSTKRNPMERGPSSDKCGDSPAMAARDTVPSGSSSSEGVGEPAEY